MRRHPPASRCFLAVMFSVFLLIQEDTVSADPLEPIEVQSFWKSQAEARSLSILRQAYERAGGTWLHSPTTDHIQNRRVLFQRILDGIPPFAVQWHAGWDLFALSKRGVIMDIGVIAERDAWIENIVPSVRPFIAEDMRFFAVPVGVHSENWTWINADVLAEFGGEVPQTWADLIAILTKMKAQGRMGLTMGRGAWERSMLFRSILSSEAGAEIFLRMFEDPDPSVVDEPGFRESIAIFDSLGGFLLDKPEVQAWEDAAVELAEGRALVQIIGDWVLPDLEALGMTVGDDLICVLSLGTHKYHQSLVDTFIFPTNEDRSVRAEHDALTRAILSPETQLDFSSNKGAIPVVNGLEDQIESSCMQKAYKLFAKEGGSLASPLLITEEAVVFESDRILSDLWDNPQMTQEAVIDQIRETLTAARDNK